jgi:hypothetical protein
MPPVGLPLVVDVNRTPVFGSATADTSGMARPGHGALAVTPAPVCHEGRAMTFEHQLPPPLQVVLVLQVPGLLVE